MNQIVFLLEERSMKVLLDGLLPRLFPDMDFLCIPHEGKKDLEKSIPRKLRAWRGMTTRFVVVQDNDGSDCRRLKSKLADLCSDSGRSDTMIRIAVQELEAWYFGDTEALSRAFKNDKLKNLNKKARYRNPDTIPKPSDAIARLVPEFQKVSGARRLAEFLSRKNNRSTSYNVFLTGLEQLLQDDGGGHG